MKNIIVILISVIILGCVDKMNQLDVHMNNLVSSQTVTEEKRYAEALNDFSGDKGLSYNLEIKLKGNQKDVSFSELSEYLSQELIIIIRAQNGGHINQWIPKDNNNIFILMRE